jgi:DNA (cytosine-5)-methyltransferase 1
MRYLSVCSGIEAATVAWHGQGFEPLAFSEIEKFPRQVLAHHYPDVPLHGDFTVLREQNWIGDADVLVGGTPCQAFSVAGLRNSLDDDRGNLTLEFVRLADAIDDLRPTGCGTIIVWENVPGVLSVKDNAFGCFLGALVGNDDPIVPTGGKWTSAGMVVGPKRSAAWRVLDAQYFGVAQRRRRVFVVASSRDGFDPAEVLFEREGVRRNTPPSREQGKDITGPITAGISKGMRGPEGVESNWAVMAKSHWDGDQYPHPTLSQSLKSSGGVGASNQEVFSQRGAYLAPVAMIHGTQDPIISDIAFPQGRNSGQENVLVQVFPIISDADRSDSRAITPSPDAEGRIRLRNPGIGIGTDTDPMYTLQSTKPHAVTYSIMPQNSGMDYKAREVDVAQPVLAGGPSGGNQGGDYVMQSTAVRRLTPRECERLQGFPDDYTAIPKAADGPRYKALGNSMAVPVMAWIGKRIAREIGQ